MPSSPILPSLEDLLERCSQILTDVPLRIMLSHFCQVRDVTNMVALPVLVDVFIMHLFPGDHGDQIKSFEDGYRIFPATAEVIHFGNTRCLDEFVHEAGDV